MINAGTFKCAANPSNTFDVYNEGIIIVRGGSFYKCDPSAYLDEGYKVEQDGDWYHVVEDTDVVVSINNKQDLYDFATAVNEGTTYEGKIVRLKADVDLNNEAWTPIGYSNGDNSKMFKGTFDGNGYTISNLNVTGTAGVKGAGLFGYVYCGAVKNLTVKNANVTGYSHVAALIGSAMCTTVDNCHVENAVVTANTWLNGEDYDDGDKVGAIVGYFSCEPTGSMTNCTVDNCEIKGYRDLGGMIGYFNAYNDQVKINGNSVKGTTVTSDKTNDYKSYSDVSNYHVGESIGFSAYTFVGTNTAANVTVTND